MILFLSDVALFGPASGAEQVLFQQALGLSQNGRRICAITRVGGNSDKINIQSEKGIQEIRYSTDTKNVFRFVWQISRRPNRLYKKFLNEKNMTIVISHQPFTFLPLLISGKLEGIPLIYVFHSPNHEEYMLSNRSTASCRINAQSLIRRWLEKYCLQKSQKILVLSRYMKRKVMTTHGIHEDRIIVNPGGVDLERFCVLNNRNKVKERLNYPPGKIHLLTVRNLEARMGLDNLIKAVYLLNRNGSNVHLTIGGEGSERKTLEKIVSDCGLENDISFKGFIPDDRLSDYYSGADFFVLPTSKLEGFGLVTVESMACGTPVLGTPVGATREILSNFGSQFIFKNTTPEAMAEGIHDAINMFLHNPHAYNKLRSQCHNYVRKNYSWHRHIQQLKSIIYELTA